MARQSIGEFEQLVLLAVMRLGEEAYGVPVLEEIRNRTERAASPAAVYIALRRLEQKKMLSSRLSDPTPRRGGRAKRFYRVELAGVRGLSRARRELLSMWDGLHEALDS